MNKMLIAAVSGFVALSAGQAFAAAAADTVVCNGATYAASFTVPAGTAGTNFIMQTFPAKCSKNVELHYTDLTNGVGVAGAAASVKGKNLSLGSSAGGSITTTACAIAGGCTATEVTTQTAAAVTAAQSS